MAIVDTNSNPTNINYPIPGNDDARRSISLYCELIKQTILDAQKYISVHEKEIKKPDIQDTSTKKEGETVKVEIKKETKNKKDKIKTEKKSKSIFSKIKKLASKKLK